MHPVEIYCYKHPVELAHCIEQGAEAKRGRMLNTYVVEIGGSNNILDCGYCG